MAKIEYKAECLCGGEILLIYKKPTRFEPTIAKARCPSCWSEFLFTFSVEYANGDRAYLPEHKVLKMTTKLNEALRHTKEQMKPAKATT